MRQNTLSQLSHRLFNTRSVLLFAAIVVGAAAATHVQAADDASQRTGVIGATSSASDTASQAPGTAPKNEAPPMTTSPAFDPTNQAAKGTGSANNPDKRPIIKATRPTAVKPATEPSELK